MSLHTRSDNATKEDEKKKKRKRREKKPNKQMQNKGGKEAEPKERRLRCVDTTGRE